MGIFSFEDGSVGVRCALRITYSDRKVQLVGLQSSYLCTLLWRVGQVGFPKCSLSRPIQTPAGSAKMVLVLRAPTHDCTNGRVQNSVLFNK